MNLLRNYYRIIVNCFKYMKNNIVIIKVTIIFSITIDFLKIILIILLLLYIIYLMINTKSTNHKLFYIHISLKINRFQCKLL